MRGIDQQKNNNNQGELMKFCFQKFFTLLSALFLLLHATLLPAQTSDSRLQDGQHADFSGKAGGD